MIKLGNKVKIICKYMYGEVGRIIRIDNETLPIQVQFEDDFDWFDETELELITILCPEYLKNE